jgi:hypothetical protein
VQRQVRGPITYWVLNGERLYLDGRRYQGPCMGWT